MAILVIGSLLPNLWKTRVFSFYVVDVICFQSLLTSLVLPLSNPPQPKTTFHLNPITLKLIFCISNFKVCFLKHFLHVFLSLCRNLSSGFKILGIFRKWVGFLNFVKIFPNLWLGWVPFDVCVSVLTPWGILSMYWGRFHHVHALFIVGIQYCMLSVWQNVLMTFLCWIGLN